MERRESKRNVSTPGKRNRRGSGNPVQSIRPAREINPAENNHTHNDGEAEGDQDKIGTSQFEGRNADKKAHEARESNGDEKGRPKTDVELHGDQAERISAYPQKGGVAQRKLPCVTEDQVHAETHDGPYGNQYQHAGHVSPHKEGDNDRGNQDKRPGDQVTRYVSF